jgi:secondary thiamine-phosphate synthase enzyme
MQTVVISTKYKRQILGITDEIEANLPAEGSGVLTVFVAHTTAAITTADLDPGTDLDFLDFLEAITPQVRWRHPHNPAHAPDHLLASIIGPSVSIPYEHGQLLLGTWQRIVLVELDGPRERSVIINI